MKKIYILVPFLLFLLNCIGLKAQTIWTGSTTTFIKEKNGDWTLEANQDRITSNVWFTRGDNGGIFNFAAEPMGATNISPKDTEWAYGTTENYASLTYQNLKALKGGNFGSIIDGQDLVLHLITDNIYIDIKFTSWKSGKGGGFSYERSTDQSIATKEF